MIWKWSLNKPHPLQLLCMPNSTHTYMYQLKGGGWPARLPFTSRDISLYPPVMASLAAGSDSSVDPPRVTALNVFPIKSCKSIQVTEIEFDEFGVAGDRRFMMMTSKGALLSQRSGYPIMATVTASFVVENGKRFLCASAPSMSWDLKFEPILEGPRVDAYVGYDEKVRVIDQGEIPAKWFNQLIGLETTFNRLVASAEKIPSAGESFQRLVPTIPPSLKNKLPPMQVCLADVAPVTVASHESLADLNARLRERGVNEVPLNRFRMNIEVAGCSRAFEEDDWFLVHIGEVPFLVYTYVERCKMTGINQDTGEVDKLGPLDILRTYRAPQGPAHARFGQQMLPLQRTGKVRVGDVVKVMEWKKY